MRTLLLLILLGTALCGSGGCLYRLKNKPLTYNIVQSREISREAHTAREKGQLEDAEKKLERAVKLNPKDPEIRRHYADVLWERGKRQQSFQQLQEATKIGIKEKNESGGVYVSHAEKLFFTNRIDEAAKAIAKAIELSPRDYLAWALHGKIQTVLGNAAILEGRSDSSETHLHQAVSDYYRALALGPSDSDEMKELLAELAELQMQLNQPQRALTVWQNLERQYYPHPQPTAYLCGKAKTLLALGRGDEAMELFRLAIERRPEEADLYVHLAEVQVQLALHDQAMETIIQLESITPNHPEIPRLARELNQLH